MDTQNNFQSDNNSTSAASFTPRPSSPPTMSRSRSPAANCDANHCLPEPETEFPDADEMSVNNDDFKLHDPYNDDDSDKERGGESKEEGEEDDNDHLDDKEEREENDGEEQEEDEQEEGEYPQSGDQYDDTRNNFQSDNNSNPAASFTPCPSSPTMMLRSGSTAAYSDANHCLPEPETEYPDADQMSVSSDDFNVRDPYNDDDSDEERGGESKEEGEEDDNDHLDDKEEVGENDGEEPEEDEQDEDEYPQSGDQYDDEQKLEEDVGSQDPTEHGHPATDGENQTAQDPDYDLLNAAWKIQCDERAKCQVPVTDDYLVNLELLHIIHFTSGKKMLFTKLRAWAQKWQRDGYVFPERGKSRETVIQDIKHRTGANELSPEAFPMKLPHTSLDVTVTRFSFPATVHRLLSDPDIVNKNNVTFPNNDPFSAPVPASERDGNYAISQMHHGLNYLYAFNQYVKDRDFTDSKGTTRKAFPAFLIFGLDKTVLDTYTRLSLEPLKFTFSFLKQSVRDRPSSWATLGYLPSMTNMPKNASPLEKLRDWHHCLSFIMQPVLEVVEAGGLFWNFVDWWSNVAQNHNPPPVIRSILKFAINSFLGDSEGQWKIAGKYAGSYAIFQCYQCQVPKDELGNAYHKCKLTDGNRIRKLRADKDIKALSSLSYHLVDSILDKLPLCSPRGLPGILPGEFLHVEQKGNYTYLLTVFFGLKVSMKTKRKKKEPAKKKPNKPSKNNKARQKGKGQASNRRTSRSTKQSVPQPKKRKKSQRQHDDQSSDDNSGNEESHDESQDNSSPPRPGEDADDESEWIIERILEYRIHNGEDMFLVEYQCEPGTPNPSWWARKSELSKEFFAEAEEVKHKQLAERTFACPLTAAELAVKNGIFTQNECARLDRFSRLYGKCCQHQSDRRLHRSYFPLGISSNSRKTAAEETLVWYQVLLAFNSQYGLMYLNTLFDGERIEHTRSQIMVELVAEMLYRDNYLHQKSTLLSDVKLFKQYNPHFVDQFLKVMNRQEGVGSDYLKAHLPLHYADNTIDIGLPVSTDSTIVELGHIQQKNEAHGTQMRDSTLDLQTGRAVTESEVIDRGYRDNIAVPSEDKVAAKDPSLIGVQVTRYPMDRILISRGRHYYATDQGIYDLKRSRSAPPSPSRWSNRLLQFLIERFITENVTPHLHSRQVKFVNYFKWKNEDGSHTIFHSEPKSNWHDWGYIKWNNKPWLHDDKDELELNPDVIPGRIMAIFEVEDDDVIQENNSNTTPATNNNATGTGQNAPFCITRGGLYCITTRCVENLFMEHATDEEFTRMYPGTDCYLACPEQDMMWFSRVREESTDGIPPELLESVAKLMPRKKKQQGQGGGGQRKVERSVRHRVQQTRVSSSVVPCPGFQHNSRVPSCAF